jgi:hypothetical protein
MGENSRHFLAAQILTDDPRTAKSELFFASTMAAFMRPETTQSPFLVHTTSTLKH